MNGDKLGRLWRNEVDDFDGQNRRSSLTERSGRVWRNEVDDFDGQNRRSSLTERSGRVWRNELAVEFDGTNGIVKATEGRWAMNLMAVGDGERVGGSLPACDGLNNQRWRWRWRLGIVGVGGSLRARTAHQHCWTSRFHYVLRDFIIMPLYFVFRRVFISYSAFIKCVFAQSLPTVIRADDSSPD